VQSKGNTDQWNKAIAENLPFLNYNHDPQQPGAPQRTGGAEVPVALIQEATIRDQELKDVFGVYDSSLGDKSNETSGRAISRRNEQGQIVNFNFPDNMAKAKQRTLEIINDLIPFHYDTERTVRVLGVDGSEEYVKINTAGIDPKTGEPVLINDLTKGKYDITVTVGPSFATQRQEAADAYSALAPQDPLLMQTSADLVYKSMDLPYSDEIAERRRAMLPPQIQALIKQGKDLPPEVKQAQALLDAGKQQLDEQGKLLAAAGEEVKTEKAAADQAKSAAEVARANLKVEQANLAVDVANFKTLKADAACEIMQKQGAVDSQGAKQDAVADRGSLETALQNAIAQIQQSTVELFQRHAEQLSKMVTTALQSAQPPQVVVANPLKKKLAISRRMPDGNIHTEISEVPAMQAPAEVH
jgi:hypothetical protein